MTFDWGVVDVVNASCRHDGSATEHHTGSVEKSESEKRASFCSHKILNLPNLKVWTILINSVLKDSLLTQRTYWGSWWLIKVTYHRTPQILNTFNNTFTQHCLKVVYIHRCIHPPSSHRNCFPWTVFRGEYNWVLLFLLDVPEPQYYDPNIPIKINHIINIPFVQFNCNFPRVALFVTLLNSCINTNGEATNTFLSLLCLSLRRLFYLLGEGLDLLINSVSDY